MLRTEPPTDPDVRDVPPRCGHCGAAIGVYEPLVYENGTGVPVHSAFLRLPAAVRSAPQAVTFFHVACFPAAG